MARKRFVLAFSVLLLVWPQVPAQRWFPFTLPWDDASPTIVDASGLLVDYPGQDPLEAIESRGQVVARADGHFYFSRTGRRARFWGVNFTFNANFPDRASAEKVAARLAKLGFNLVRFHHMDYFARPDGIWDPRYFPNDTQHLDPEQLDRWDYLVYQLRRHGSLGPSFTTSLYNSGPNHPLQFGDRLGTWPRVLTPPVAILFDFGAVHEGLCYDFGRTVSFGEPDAQFREVYDRALAALRPASGRIG